MTWKDGFKHSIDRPGAPLHFASHGHHPWPDVTEAAQARYWRDSAARLDRKWATAVQDELVKAQAHVARIVNLSRPGNIVFGANAHEFVLRLFSCLPVDRTPRVLTTDAEFHSFARQCARLEEENLIEVRRVPTEPFDTFTERFYAAAAEGGWDLVYVSQVFFNSGFWVRDLETLTEAVSDSKTYIAIDGYHGFCAVPTDLSALEGRIFYLAGGYKYAMSGENCCFFHCPAGYGRRPRNTGWFAGEGLQYPEDGGRFAGSTFDQAGLYRFNAAMDWLEKANADVEAALTHVRGLQTRFLEGVHDTVLGKARLLADPRKDACGRFLAFQTEFCADLCSQLNNKHNIITNTAGDRLRIGFGVYHDAEDVERLITALMDIKL